MRLWTLQMVAKNHLKAMREFGQDAAPRMEPNDVARLRELYAEAEALVAQLEQTYRSFE